MPELIGVEPGSPEWLAARRQGVTATDIVKILGLSSKTAYWLYWNKLGQVPDELDNDRFRLGRELESYVLDRYQEATGGLPFKFARNKLHRSSVRPWQMATVDALNASFEPVEAKSWADADRHSWNDGPPAAVRAQLLWQMDVMDVAVGHVGVVFLPSGEFRSYVIEHDPAYIPDGPDAEYPCPCCQDIKLMLERGEEFWRRLRGELPPPDVDGSAASLAALKARFGDVRKDKTVPVDGTLWALYDQACHKIEYWEDEKHGHENQIRELIGEAGRIEVGGELVAHHLVYDAQVKAHMRHVDMIRRVKQKENGDAS